MTTLYKSLLFILFTTYTVFSYSQVEPAEVPMFGNSKNLNDDLVLDEDPINPDLFNPANVHDFGKVKGSPQSYTFTLKNSGLSNLDIIDIKLPAKVGVSVDGFHIKPGMEGRFTATIDPTVMNKGPFQTWFIITTQQKEPGTLITREIYFAVKGEIK